MKRIFVFFICLGLLFNIGSAYEIKDKESVVDRFIVPQDNEDINFTIKPDYSAREYVKSYVVGGETAIQVCEVGGLSSSHAYSANEEYCLNEIVNVVLPTCEKDGSMTIKCKYPISGFLGFGTKDCGNEETIVLKKTGHFINSENDDKKCERCGEIVIHSPKDEWYANDKVHYKNCEIDGCLEIFSVEEHSGGTHENDGYCQVCGKKYQSHLMDTNKFSFNDEEHFYGCSYQDCGEIFSGEKHEKGDIEEDSENHWYKCKNEDCTYVFDKEGHTYGDDGKCIVCKRLEEIELDNIEIENAPKGEYELTEVGDSVLLKLKSISGRLNNKDFVWESTDETIVAVNRSGEVFAKGSGQADIEIYYKGEKVAKCTIYVNIEEFTIEVDDDELFEGKSTYVRVTPSSVLKSVEWEIENNNGLIDFNRNTGKITAREGVVGEKGQTVTIVATLENGSTAQVEIFVKPKSTSSNNQSEGTQANNGSTTGNTTSKSSTSNKSNTSQNGTSTTNKNNSSTSTTTNKNNSSANSTTNKNNSSTSTTTDNTWHHDDTNDMHYKMKKGTSGRMIIDRTTREDCQYDSNGVCTICGYQKGNQGANCKHISTTIVHDNNEESTTHFVKCAMCGVTIREEECPGESCRKKYNNQKEIETSIKSYIERYYVEEDGVTTVDGVPTEINLNIKSSSGTPKFKWKLSTIPGKEFSSDDESSDGTIVFGCKNGKFYAHLEKTDIAALAEEVKVTITLLDGGNVATDTIVLIKVGPPASRCLVYLDDEYITLNENSLDLMIRTVYNNFTDEEVREIGEKEFPLYTVKDNKIEVTSRDTSMLSVNSSSSISKVADDKLNGYTTSLSVTPHKVGVVPIDIKLSTEYIFENHKPVVETREYTAMINIVEKEEDKKDTGSLTDDNSNKNNTDSQNGNTGKGLSTAILAAGGAIALLLIAAVASKMMSK